MVCVAVNEILHNFGVENSEQKSQPTTKVSRDMNYLIK